MFGYSLFFLIDVIFIVHAAKTGRFWPWAYVILFLPGIGTLAYIAVEMLPQYRYAPQVRRARTRLNTRINPDKRYRALRSELEIADTIGNRLALAKECLRLQRYEEALALFDAILAAPTGDEPLYMLGRAQAEFGLDRPQAALATLDTLKRRWPQYHSQDGHLLYAKALEKADRPVEALAEYEDLSRYFAGQEVQVRRFLLLDRLGRADEAEKIAGDIMRYRERAPRHARHQQAEWFAAVRRYLRSRPKVG